MNWAEAGFLVRHPLAGIEAWWVREIVGPLYADRERAPRVYKCHPAEVVGKPLNVAAAMLGLVKETVPPLEWPDDKPALGKVPTHNDI